MGRKYDELTDQIEQLARLHGVELRAILEELDD